MSTLPRLSSISIYGSTFAISFCLINSITPTTTKNAQPSTEFNIYIALENNLLNSFCSNVNCIPLCFAFNVVEYLGSPAFAITSLLKLAIKVNIVIAHNTIVVAVTPNAYQPPPAPILPMAYSGYAYICIFILISSPFVIIEDNISPDLKHNI